MPLEIEFKPIGVGMILVPTHLNQGDLESDAGFSSEHLRNVLCANGLALPREPFYMRYKLLQLDIKGGASGLTSVALVYVKSVLNLRDTTVKQMSCAAGVVLAGLHTKKLLVGSESVAFHIDKVSSPFLISNSGLPIIKFVSNSQKPMLRHGGVIAVQTGDITPM